MKKTSIPFIVRTFPTVIPPIYIGGNVEFPEGPYRVTSIQSVKYVSGIIEVKGWCKEITRRKGDGEQVSGISKK